MSALRRLAALGVATIAMAGGTAGADAPQQHGWWTTANAGLPGVPAVVGADVPADGLLVQGGPSSPTAYAALVYDVPDDQAVGPLTLSVAANSVSTADATLLACPLEDGSFEPAQGGPMAEAPAYDCSRQTTATPNGASYAFNVASLASGGTLAVAILPANPTDRVVFDPAGEDSLSALPGPSDPLVTPTTTPPISNPALGGADPTFDAPSLPIPAPTADPADPEVAAPGAPPAPAPGFVPTGVVGPANANPAAVAAVLAGAAVGGALWLGARRAAVRDALAVT